MAKPFGEPSGFRHLRLSVGDLDARVQRAIDRYAWPDEALCTRLHELARQGLESAGYSALDAGHFVLDDDELATARRRGHCRVSPLGPTAAPEAVLLRLGPEAIDDVGGARWFDNGSADGALEPCGTESSSPLDVDH